MILVTGATGLVGSHLVYQLCKAGKKVRLLKRSTTNVSKLNKIFSNYSDDYENYSPLIEWFDADLQDVFSLMDLMEGVTEVYHCAALVSFNSKDKEQLITTNVNGTKNLCIAALEKKSINFYL